MMSQYSLPNKTRNLPADTAFLSRFLKTLHPKDVKRIGRKYGQPLFTDNTQGHDIDQVAKLWAAAEEMGALHNPLMTPEDVQIELINHERMIHMYVAGGLPVTYRYWLFGQEAQRLIDAYRRGEMGLAYEVIPNTYRQIIYCMRENTLVMQLLVLLHAGLGHRLFFRENFKFQQIPLVNRMADASNIVNFLVKLAQMVEDAYENHPDEEVRKFLDAMNALQNYGKDAHPRDRNASPSKRKQHLEKMAEFRRLAKDDLFDKVVHITEEKREKLQSVADYEERMQALGLSKGSRGAENILLFLFYHSPELNKPGSEWKKALTYMFVELNRYFYSQRETQVGNEGTATFWHWVFMNRFYDAGMLTDGHMMEFFQSHSGVINQVPFLNQYYNGINVYPLGFSIMVEICRVCLEPTPEDIEWFSGMEPRPEDKDYCPDRPKFAGCAKNLPPAQAWEKMVSWLNQASSEYIDESLLLQFLTPNLMRAMRLVSILDDAKEKHLLVEATHADDNLRTLRKTFSEQYSHSLRVPDLRVVDARLDEPPRTLKIKHYTLGGKLLEPTAARDMLAHLVYLWGEQFDVEITAEDKDTKKPNSWSLAWRNGEVVD